MCFSAEFQNNVRKKILQIQDCFPYELPVQLMKIGKIKC